MDCVTVGQSHAVRFLKLPSHETVSGCKKIIFAKMSHCFSNWQYFCSCLISELLQKSLFFFFFFLKRHWQHKAFSLHLTPRGKNTWEGKDKVDHTSDIEIQVLVLMRVTPDRTCWLSWWTRVLWQLQSGPGSHHKHTLPSPQPAGLCVPPPLQKKKNTQTDTVRVFCWCVSESWQ